MGRLYAEELNEFGSESGYSLETIIGVHLSTNHYPPIPSVMIAPCIEAIDAHNEGDYYRGIELPEGVSWKGYTSAPAYALVSDCHLESFISDPLDCDDIA